MFGWIDHASTWLDLVSLASDAAQTVDFLDDAVQTWTWAVGLGGSGQQKWSLVNAKRACSHLGLLTWPGQADLTALGAIRPHLAGFSCKSTAWKAHGPFDNTKRSQASGWHAQTAHVRCVYCQRPHQLVSGLNPPRLKGFQLAVPRPTAWP